MPTLGTQAMHRERNSLRAASGGNSFLPAPLGFLVGENVQIIEADMYFAEKMLVILSIAAML